MARGAIGKGQIPVLQGGPSTTLRLWHMRYAAIDKPQELLLLDEGLRRASKSRNFFRHRFLDNIRINIKISVDEPVPHPDDGEKQHTIGVQVSTFSSSDELLKRLRCVNHVQDTHAVVIAHTGPVRTEPLHP
jgi:hypothetical protein